MKSPEGLRWDTPQRRNGFRERPPSGSQFEEFAEALNRVANSQLHTDAPVSRMGSRRLRLFGPSLHTDKPRPLTE